MSKTIKTLSHAECEKLLKSTKRPADYLLFLLFLDAGLRLQEAVLLSVMDLWFDGEPVKVISIRSGIAKGHRAREIPVSNQLKQAILFSAMNFWITNGYEPSSFAFSNTAGHEPVSTRCIQHRLAKLGSETIHRHVTPHMLRHTFATKLMRKCSIRIVQKLLGHASITSTQIYTHPNSNDLQDAINSI